MDLKPNTWPPLCIAHRGFSAQCPENTYVAFDAAIEAPIVGIETDLQLTADDVPVIYHNRTLKLVGGGLKRVRTQKLSQVAQLDFGSWMDRQFEGEPLPLLDELLQRYGQKTCLLLEIKLRERDQLRLQRLMDLLLARLQSMGLEERVMILCFDLDLLRYGHQRAPDVRYVWNQMAPARFAEDAHWLYAYSLNHRAVNKELVQRIQAAGKSVMTFTVDDERILSRVVAAGVNAVMANDPQWLANQLKQYNTIEKDV